MKPHQIGLGVTIESQPVSQLPVNCDAIARLYVGDVEYVLVRAQRERALYLVARGVAWRVDVAGLLASFATSLREWDRERELMLGIHDRRVGPKLRAVKKSSAR